ncbi:crossover junction endonuclease MUS81 isoform X2 [Rhodamnia argentea]|uniref:Crossover junction endonuclease MUS81 n=1 Tax=Rhodamnia argentea TaxID=178133 RepID=A0ABM3HD14_9MYRT|nr:crossover junction endonuclease MUS81 isoform X2 [Rhodamnia argentea]
MEDQTGAVCPSNEGLVHFMLQKKLELSQAPKGLSENVEATLARAIHNISQSQSPINSLKELSQLKGVGKWILKLVRRYFENDSPNSENEDLTTKGKNAKATKRYLPKKNSVAYTLLITLYRGTSNGNEYMRKQELIDAAEASGLSRVPIVPEKGKGKPGQFGSSPREWYSGWSCMKTLITKGLVMKSSSPAKYMLSQEGKDAARDCLLRSGLAESAHSDEGSLDLDMVKGVNLETASLESSEDLTVQPICGRKRQNPPDIPPQTLERFLGMGYAKEQVLHAVAEVSKTSDGSDISALWPAILCQLKEDQVYGCSISTTFSMKRCSTSTRSAVAHGQVYIEGSQSTREELVCDDLTKTKYTFTNASQSSFTVKPCSSNDYPASGSGFVSLEGGMNVLSKPPLNFGERFQDVYEVILILDDREQFATRGSRSQRIIDNICSQFSIKVEVRRLPVGDGIWIARHKYNDSEYVLDFIVERKKVEDLRSSIRDNRYKDQKLKLLRCGLKKLIYLVEGDPNHCEAAESIKTACFTTEILEGFDVQRTSGLAGTLKNYGHLTQAIIHYYTLQLQRDQSKCTGVCPPFDEFIKRCQDVEKMTVSDVFAIQLMQVPQVTEEAAIAVIDMYPTLLSLARAYALLDGDLCAQEEMLMKQTNNVVSKLASKNIFRLVWGD